MVGPADDDAGKDPAASQGRDQAVGPGQGRDETQLHDGQVCPGKERPAYLGAGGDRRRVG